MAEPEVEAWELGLVMGSKVAAAVAENKQLQIDHQKHHQFPQAGMGGGPRLAASILPVIKQRHNMSCLRIHASDEKLPPSPHYRM